MGFSIVTSFDLFISDIAFHPKFSKNLEWQLKQNYVCYITCKDLFMILWLGHCTPAEFSIKTNFKNKKISQSSTTKTPVNRFFQPPIRFVTIAIAIHTIKSHFKKSETFRQLPVVLERPHSSRTWRMLTCASWRRVPTDAWPSSTTCCRGRTGRASCTTCDRRL